MLFFNHSKLTNYLSLIFFLFRYQHCIYTRLLNRYLEDKYKDVYKALEKFQIINQLLSELIPGRGILESIILNSDRSQLALLINEIYNQ